MVIETGGAETAEGEAGAVQVMDAPTGRPGAVAHQLGFDEETDAALERGVILSGSAGGEGFEGKAGQGGADRIVIGEGTGEGLAGDRGRMEGGIAGGPSAAAMLVAAEPGEGVRGRFGGGLRAPQGEQGESGFLSVGVEFRGELAGEGRRGQRLAAKPGGDFGGRMGQSQQSQRGIADGQRGGNDARGQGRTGGEAGQPEAGRRRESRRAERQRRGAGLLNRRAEPGGDSAKEAGGRGSEKGRSERTSSVRVNSRGAERGADAAIWAACR